jgi:glycolate oxidase FAD binding subunit
MPTPSTSESLRRTEPRWSELEAIAPVRMASAADSVEGVLPARVVAPEDTGQVSSVLKWANERDVHIVARGGGSKLGWSNLPSGMDLVLSLEKFQSLVEHAWQDMTVTVQAGATIATLQAELAKHGQRLPLDALWPDRSTVGGVIATNESGALRLRFGSIRDLILGATAVLANGTIARSGGRVVKNVAGYDLPKLFTGSMGTLGVITEVTLRTYPLPHSTRTLSFRFQEVAAANRYMLAVSDTTLVPASMQLRTSNDEAAVVDLCFEGLEEGIAAQVLRATELATAAPVLAPAHEVWNSREKLWNDAENAVIGKFSVLPSSIVDCVEVIRSRSSQFKIVAQSLGLGFFRVRLDNLESFLKLRAALQKLRGSFTVLHAPIEMKKNIDVFGELTTAYPLMVRIKQQFDPKGILSPGRFVGGI